MVSVEDDDIDTGPGLEPRHSCKIMELTDLPSPQRKLPPKSESSEEVKVDAGLAHNILANGNSRHEEPQPLHLPGSEKDARQLSGFAASSSAPWNEDQQSSKPSGLATTASRAETMEELDERVRAEKRAKRAERAAQISSLATLSLLLIAATLFLVLAYTGWNAIAAAVALFCASIAGYPFLHLLFYGLSSQMFARTWSRLTPVERFKWGQKGASLVHSGIMAAVGLSIVLQGSWRVQDLLTQRDDRVAAFIGLDLGYLIQDTGMEAYKHFAFGRSSSPLHWLHHVPLLGLLPWYYKYHKADFFVGALFMWSTSTVPLHLRWFQVHSGMDKGVLYQLNNAALLLSFLACRIISIPLLLRLYGIARGLAFIEVPIRIHWTFTAACVVVMIGNFGWLIHLLKNAFKTRSGRYSRRSKVDKKAA